jgi:hypothetical protein
MTLSSLLIRIIFLTFPGIIGSILYRKLRGRPVRKDWEDYVEIAVFSLASYALYGLIVFVLKKAGLSSGTVTVLQAFLDEKVQVVWQEIVYASLCGVLLSFIAAYIHTYKLVTRFGQLVRATTSFGEEDVWDFFHNRPDIQWVYIRDLKYDLSYRCWIEEYSDAFKERELLLREVDVYRNSTGESLYHCDVVYFSMKHDEFTIEAAIVDEPGTNNTEAT